MLLQHLITFCRVVEEGSFTGAARVQNLTQPSVTKQVGALEDHLQIQLFTRRGKQVHLTPAGELVYSYARQILELVERCEEAVRELRSPGGGHITIGCVHTIGLFTLPDLLAEFVREHPLVRINVKTGNNTETVTMLLRGEVDIGLVTTPPADDRIEAVPLFEDPVVVVANPEYASRMADPVTPDDLAEEPMISFVRGTRFRITTDQLLEQMGVTPNVIMEFDNHEAIKAMVALGFGIALQPLSAVRKELRAGTLVQVNVPSLPHSSRTTAAILRREERRRPTVKSFLELLERHFQRGAAEE